MGKQDSRGFTTELKRGTLELLLLHLLAERPKYGYELVRELQSGDEIEIKEGTVYPVLYRLEDRGLVVPEWQARARGVPRKYYQLTAEGRRRLVELQREWRTYVRWVEESIVSKARADDTEENTAEENTAETDAVAMDTTASPETDRENGDDQ